MDKASIGGVLLAIVGHRGRTADGRRQPGPDPAAHRGADRLWRHHGRGAAAVPAHHRRRRVPQRMAMSSPRRASRTIELIRLLVAFANKARRNGVVSLDADLQTIQDPFLKQTRDAGRRRHRARRPAQDHAASVSTPPPKARSGSPRSSNRPAASRPPSAFSARCWDSSR